MPDQDQKPVDSIVDGLTGSIGKITALIGAVTAAVTALLKFITTEPWYVIAAVVFVVLLVAVAGIWLYRRQQQTKRQQQFAENSGAAFRGLLPFEEGDSDSFFGRETDIGELLQLVRYSEFRFGVLTGASGCGKTSLLRAGLIPKLRKLQDLPVYLRLYGDPDLQITQAVSIQTGITVNPDEGLQAYLQRVSQEKGQTLVLCCDQFEEFFINHPDPASRMTFIEFVAGCFEDTSLAVKFLFSLREDFLVKISEFDGKIPDPLSIDKRYHLKNFDSIQAETIIQRSVENAGLPFEPDLAGTIASDLVKDHQVLPTELQIICQQLQRQRIFTSDQYLDSGGKESLAYTFLEDVIQGAGSEKEVKLVLRSMISEEDTKLALTREQIAKNAQQSEKQVKDILHQFVDARLIREIQDHEPWRYELMHEYLIGKINAVSGSVMDAVKRANHIFKQWLNRYQRDHRTLIPLADCHFIRRYSDLDRNGSAGELLSRSLWMGWLKAGVLSLAVMGIITFIGWQFWHEIRIRERKIGLLVVNNPVDAQLTLTRIRHYREEGDAPETTVENELLKGSEIYLEGPADFLLTAMLNNQTWHYPVYIEKHGHTITIVIEQPPENIPEDMAYIPAGSFRMGDKNDEDGVDGNAKPHDVYLDAFLIDKTEVSNEDYKKFIDAGGYQDETLWKEKHPSGQSGLKFLKDMENPKQPNLWNVERFNQKDHPVVGVSWYEARAYCRWKNKRLPTEAQWEKAARGPEGFEWSFGNEWNETKANIGVTNDGYNGKVPVTAYQTNSYGLYNMSGNAWEWVQDVYDVEFYTSNKGKVKNPVNESKKWSRVVRGGSWISDFPGDLRASNRGRDFPDGWDYGIGFRCARTL